MVRNMFKEASVVRVACAFVRRARPWLDSNMSKMNEMKKKKK